MLKKLKLLVTASALFIGSAAISEAAVLDFSGVQGDNGTTLSITHATLNSFNGASIVVGPAVAGQADGFCFVLGTCEADGELLFDSSVSNLTFDIDGASNGDFVAISAYNGLALLATLNFTANGIADFSAFSGITRLFFDDSSSAAGVGFSTFSFDIDRVSAVPLPAALPLYGAGLALIGFMGWRRKRNARE